MTVDINNIGRIHIVVIVDHCRGTFCFPMKLIYVIHDEKIIERESYVEYMPCKNVNGVVLYKTIIMKIGESFNELLHCSLFNNQHTLIPNIFVTGNLAFLVAVMEK